jgi:hypothetical protein
MDYEKHYNLLIERAKGRTLEGYSERHHIIPKCMGGSNSKDNLVRLTAEEHYVAHQLLVKMYPNNHKLIWAATAMSYGNKKQKRRNNNKSYAWLRKRFSKMISESNLGKKHSPERRANMSKSRIGKKTGPRSQETKDKMSLASKGVLKSEAHKLALSKARTGLKTKPHSEEAKRKISESNKASAKNRDFSHMQDEDYKLSQSNKMKEIWAMRKSGILPLPSRNKEI